MVYLPHFPIPKKEALATPGLSRIKKILENLGNPQNKLPPVIHVAGTNGKGSVVAFLTAIFQAANYKTHIYTSPHLHHVNERIVIANNQIDDNYLYEILEEIRLNSEEIPLTLFEGLTLAAILSFSKNPADICIFETGMGGRIDATNIIENKILTILTSISHDHMEFLGSDIKAIAAEKSHIMRTNIPCVVAPQAKEVGTMIEFRALEISAPLIHFDQDFQIEINEDETFDFKYFSSHEYLNHLPKPSLPGEHQYLNSSLAIATIYGIKNFQTANFNISQNAIEAGLINVKWPSRLEKINNNLNKILKNSQSEIYIDGAHNPGGAYALAKWIRDQIIEDKENNSPKRNYLIIGFTKNKCKKEFFEPFLNLVDFVCAVRVEGEPNPEDAEIICEKISELQKEQNNFSGNEPWCNPEDDLIDALTFLSNLDQNHPCRIIICGSLYLARDMKKANKMVNAI